MKMKYKYLCIVFYFINEKKKSAEELVEDDEEEESPYASSERSERKRGRTKLGRSRKDKIETSSSKKGGVSSSKSKLHSEVSDVTREDALREIKVKVMTTSLRRRLMVY